MRHEKHGLRLIAILLVAVLTLPLTVTAFAAAYPYETVSMDDVNMRRYANTTSIVLRKIAKGDAIKVLGERGDFYQIEYDGHTGYAMKKYIDGTDPSPDPSPSASMVFNPPLAITSYPYDTTTAGFVKLRKKPSETAEVIRTLPTGSVITVYSVENNFARVQHEKTTGYVYAGYVNLANIPVVTPTPAPTAVPGTEKYAELKNGDTGSAVRALQEALKELGYFDDEIDSKFGQRTESALKTFQTRNGLERTGVADQELQLLLYEGTPKDYNGYRQYVKTVAPIAGATVKPGSTGEAVEKVQTRLKELGYYNGEINGECDNATVTAIKDFEYKQGLEQDGTLVTSDLNLLYGVSALNASVVVTPSPTPTPQAPSGTVRKNDKSNDAKLVQTRLKELGYYTGNITGTFNDASVDALKKFQKANGLTADGVCGVQSRAVLFAAHPVYAVPTPAPVVTQNTTTTTATTTYPVITQDNVVVLRAGSRGDTVLYVQRRLQELGYYTSRLDGVYLSDDITAVRAFQSANGLKVDGKAGYNTQTALFSDAAISSSSASATTTTTTATTELSYGSQGATVVSLQNRLIELGYLTGTADGKFGPNTRTALIAFQKANNLTADGVANTTTMTALNSSNAEDNKVPYVTLRIGSTSAAVTDLQNRLIALGYLKGKADGKFGVQTNLALIAFQKANSLTADGIAGTTTIKKLNSTSVVNADGSQTSTATATAPTVSSVSAANVRYANWYTEVRAKARAYPNVTVYDFTTGISWQLNIFSNGAHADAEPITATDTANMNRAFGSTTWTPKAVWVVFSDGTVYIASTHNTPHDTWHNKTNNFDGHVCIHFPRTEAQVAAIGSYATSHQRAIDLGWAATLRRAGQ